MRGQQDFGSRLSSCEGDRAGPSADELQFSSGASFFVPLRVCIAGPDLGGGGSPGFRTPPISKIVPPSVLFSVFLYLPYFPFRVCLLFLTTSTRRDPKTTVQMLNFLGFWGLCPPDHPAWAVPGPLPNFGPPRPPLLLTWSGPAQTSFLVLSAFLDIKILVLVFRLALFFFGGGGLLFLFLFSVLFGFFVALVLVLGLVNGIKLGPVQMNCRSEELLSGPCVRAWMDGHQRFFVPRSFVSLLLFCCCYILLLLFFVLLFCVVLVVRGVFCELFVIFVLWDMLCQLPGHLAYSFLPFRFIPLHFLRNLSKQRLWSVWNGEKTDLWLDQLCFALI